MLTFYVILHLNYNLETGQQTHTLQHRWEPFIFDSKEACDAQVFKIVKKEWDDFEVYVSDAGNISYSTVRFEQFKSTIQCKQIFYDPDAKG
jgi:hypothetical protein